MRALALAAVGTALWGCQPERLNPGAVAMGLARLGVRNAAVLTSLLTEDVRCGFASPDAIVVRHEAELDGFIVARSDSKASLALRSGRLAWEGHPRLAVGAATGLCTVPTKELGVAELRFDGAEVFVDSGERRFEVEVPASRLDAQLGRWGDRENELGGELTVWDTAVAVPVSGDAKGLNTDYDAAAFDQGYACTPDLLAPVPAN